MASARCPFVRAWVPSLYVNAGLSPVRGAASTAARPRRQGLSNRLGLKSPPRLFKKSFQAKRKTVPSFRSTSWR
ncbi:hypothetical protein BBK36DRAFT_168301, partial [Trichoderma citrinoviride]